MNNNSEHILNIDNIVDNNGKIILKKNLDNSNPKLKLILSKIKIWNKKHILNKNNF